MHPDIPVLDDNPPRGGLARGVLVIVTAIAIGAFVITQGFDDTTVEAGASADEEVVAGAGRDDASGAGAGGDSEGGDGDQAGLALTTTTAVVTTVESTTTSEVAADTTSTEAAAPTVRPPGEVPVLVLNGAGSKGIAGEGASVLQAAGYDVLAPKNANSLGPSQVLYLDTFQAEANAVATAFGVDPTLVVAPFDPAAPPFDEIRNAIVIVIIGQDGLIEV